MDAQTCHTYLQSLKKAVLHGCSFQSGAFRSCTPRPNFPSSTGWANKPRPGQLIELTPKNEGYIEIRLRCVQYSRCKISVGRALPTGVQLVQGSMAQSLSALLLGGHSIFSTACAHRVYMSPCSMCTQGPTQNNASTGPHVIRMSDAMLQIGLTAAFGGGIASSILLQRPDKAPIAVFAGNYIGL